MKRLINGLRDAGSFDPDEMFRLVVSNNDANHKLVEIIYQLGKPLYMWNFAMSNSYRQHICLDGCTDFVITIPRNSQRVKFGETEEVLNISGHTQEFIEQFNGPGIKEKVDEQVLFSFHFNGLVRDFIFRNREVSKNDLRVSLYHILSILAEHKIFERKGRGEDSSLDLTGKKNIFFCNNKVRETTAVAVTRKNGGWYFSLEENNILTLADRGHKIFLSHPDFSE